MKKYNRFINREISWLQFNERVLQEASDKATPLLERLKFLGIFSNNLDEFFRVRVATINRMIDFKSKKFRHGGYAPERLIEEINTINEGLQVKFRNVYKKIIKQLEYENIFLVNENELTPEQGTFVYDYFRSKVRPNLFPLMLKNLRSSIILRDKSIYLAVILRKRDSSIPEDYALIKVPTSVIPRYVELPEQGEKRFVIVLDDVIRYCLQDIFKMFDYDEFGAYTVKFTRDAELDIDNDVSKSFMELVSESLKQRKIGQPVRFIYDKDIPEKLLGMIIKTLKISKKDKISEGGRYHNSKDLMNFPSIGKTHLLYPKLDPIPHRDLENQKSLFSILRKKEIMLHFPYQSFQYVIDLIREASIDPNVTSIKMTIYRVANNSNVMNSLISAARNGKRVTVCMEIQARFDEKLNIYWSEKLQEEGVKVIHGVHGLKVHSKLLLIKRKENRSIRYYAYIGTGNFNEQTAKIYADNSLLMSNKKVGEEIDKIFALFEFSYLPFKFNQLIVSPFRQRDFFRNLINKEIEQARRGKKAKIILKLNNLVDEKIIRKLYQASNAGVKIQLIVRGICVLVPGVKGLSENIEAVSIVDKFLEHSRIFYFYHAGEELFYISSADWMARNFDHRIEVSIPIENNEIREELRAMLEIQLADNTKSRIISEEKINQYKSNKGKEIRSQFDFYKYLQAKHQK